MLGCSIYYKYNAAAPREGARALKVRPDFPRKFHASQLAFALKQLFVIFIEKPHSADVRPGFPILIWTTFYIANNTFLIANPTKHIIASAH